MSIFDIKIINQSLYCLNRDGSIPFAGYVNIKHYDNHNVGIYRDGDGKILYVFSAYLNNSYSAILEFREGAVNQFYTQDGTQINFENFREINYEIIWDLFHYIRQNITYAIQPYISNKVIRLQEYLSLFDKCWIKLYEEENYLKVFCLKDYEDMEDIVIPIFSDMDINTNTLVFPVNERLYLGFSNLNGYFCLLGDEGKKRIDLLLDNNYDSRTFKKNGYLLKFLSIREICIQEIERQNQANLKIGDFHILRKKDFI